MQEILEIEQIMDEQMGLELNEANLDSVLDEIRPYLVGARLHEHRSVVIIANGWLSRSHSSHPGVVACYVAKLLLCFSFKCCSKPSVRWGYEDTGYVQHMPLCARAWWTLHI